MRSFKQFIGAGIMLCPLLLASTKAVADTYMHAWLWAQSADSPLGVPYEAERRDVLIHRDGSRPVPGSAIVRRTEVGRYTVELIGGNTPGGNIHVTAVGGNEHCKPDRWYPANDREYIQVRCFTPSGELSNSQFILTFSEVRPLQPGILRTHQAHLWANSASSTSYAPDPRFSRNTTGAVNRINRISEGYYRAVLPGIKNAGYDETAMVTAYGIESHRCKLSSWRTTGEEEMSVWVRCFDSNGEPADSRFFLSFYEDIWDFGPLWVPISASRGLIDASGASLTRSGLEPELALPSLGVYLFSTSSYYGLRHTVPMVTAHGRNSDYCNIGYLTLGSVVDSQGRVLDAFYYSVACYDYAGHPKASGFAIQHLNPVLPPI